MSVSAQDVKNLREQTGAGMMDCKKALTETRGDFAQALEFLKKQGLAKAEKRAGRVAAEGLVFCERDEKAAVLLELNCETDFVAKNEDFINFGKNLAKTVFQKGFGDVNDVLQFKWDGSTVENRINEFIAKIGEKVSLRRVKKMIPKSSGKLGQYSHMGGKIIVVAEVTGKQVTEESIKDVCMQVAAMNPRFVDKSEVPVTILNTEKKIFLEQMKDSGKPVEILEKIIQGKLNKFASEISLLQQIFVKDASGKNTVGQYLKEIDQDARVIQFERFAVGEGIEKKQEDFVEEVAKMAK